MNLKNKFFLYFLIFINFISILFFQNCSYFGNVVISDNSIGSKSNSSTSVSFPYIANNSGGGNGGTYEGKLKILFHYAANFTCEGGKAPESILVRQVDMKWYLIQNTPDKCDKYGIQVAEGVDYDPVLDQALFETKIYIQPTDFSDGLGTFNLANFTLQSFTTQKILSSTFKATVSQSVHPSIEYNGAIYAIGSGGITKSIDGGTTWNLVSSFQVHSGVSTTLKKLTLSGSKFILQGQYNAPNGYDSLWFVAESNDAGLTWITTHSFPVGTAYVYDSEFTTDNHIILLASYYYLNSSSDSKVYRCNLADDSCIIVDLYHSTMYRAYFESIRKDANNNFYIAGKNDNYVVKKSTDQGLTWTLLDNFNGSGGDVLDFKISSDGLKLMYGGFNTLSGIKDFVRESSDGGLTWTQYNSPCNGWELDSIILNSNKDALITCWVFIPAPGSANVFKKANGVSTWTQVFSIPGDTNGLFSQLPSGIIFYYTGTKLKTSLDFGNTWNDILPYPTRQMNLNAEFTAGLQSFKDSATLFSVGYEATASSATSSRGVVYKSTDNGTTWSKFAVSIGSFSLFNSIIQNSSNYNLFVSANYGWHIEKYDDSTSSWSVVDNYVPPTNSTSSTASINQLIRNANNTIYAIGSYNDTNTIGGHWFVRSSNNDGTTWNNLDDYQYATGTNAYSIANNGLHDGTTLYIVGTARESTLTYHWLIRKFDGTSWSIDDDDTFSPNNLGASALGITQDANGTIYVVGNYTDANHLQHWIVKQKIKNSNTWVLLDDYTSEFTRNASAQSASVDALGRVFVSGYSSDIFGAQVPTIRMYQNSEWVTVEKNQDYPTGNIKGLTPCQSNKMCAVGSFNDASSALSGFFQILK